MEAQKFLEDDRYDVDIEELSTGYIRNQVLFYNRLLIDSVRELTNLIQSRASNNVTPLDIEIFGKYTDYAKINNSSTEQIFHYFYVDIWNLTASTLKIFNPKWISYLRSPSILMRLFRKKYTYIYRYKVEIISIEDYAFFDLSKNLLIFYKNRLDDTVLVSSSCRLAHFPLSVLNDKSSIELLQKKISDELKICFFLK